MKKAEHRSKELLRLGMAESIYMKRAADVEEVCLLDVLRAVLNA